MTAIWMFEGGRLEARNEVQVSGCAGLKLASFGLGALRSFRPQTLQKYLEILGS